MTPRWSRLALATALMAVAAACGQKKPKIIAIEIVPASVQVASDPLRETTFELEARLWTGTPAERRSITAKQGFYSVTWISSPTWLTKIGGSGYRATFGVPKSQSGSALVMVKAGGKTSLAAPISVAEPTLAGEDAATAKYVAGKVPDAVLTYGVRNTLGGDCTETHDALVTRAMLGRIVGACTSDAGSWGAGVLAVDRRMMLKKEAWTPNPPDNIVQSETTLDAPLSLRLALRVMVGDVSLGSLALTQLKDKVLQQAKEDVKASNHLLAETRTGVQLIVDNEATALAADKVDISSCADGDLKTSSGDTKSLLLHVYYVNSLGLGAYRGLTCAWHSPRERDVIYVSYESHSPTTLVHELGHALGLTLPGQGHADIIAGLDGSNIMTSGENDLDPGGRRHLAVGQVFRMNADSASWLNRAVDAFNKPVRESTAPRGTCQCGATDPAGRCPRLADDVARPSEVPGTAQPWDCVDELQLTTPDETEELPVALFGGRRWRARPAECSTNLHGLAVKRWIGTIFIEVENLTRPGGCASWAALFSKVHGVRYIGLRETPDSGWTQGADQWIVLDPVPLPPLNALKVHMYYPAGAGNKAIVDQDKADVEKTFGASGRSGIALTVEPMTPGAPCPAAIDWPRELSVCYLPAGNAEAKLSTSGPGLIEVSLTNRKPTTVSHFVGRTLLLNPIGTSDPPMPGNIMQPLPANRGPKLTLGQVFRINSTLTSSLPNPLPKCDPGPCPDLDADPAP
jgi:hypothetical protein